MKLDIQIVRDAVSDYNDYNLFKEYNGGGVLLYNIRDHTLWTDSSERAFDEMERDEDLIDLGNMMEKEPLYQPKQARTRSTMQNAHKLRRRV